MSARDDRLDALRAPGLSPFVPKWTGWVARLTVASGYWHVDADCTTGVVLHAPGSGYIASAGPYRGQDGHEAAYHIQNGEAEAKRLADTIRARWAGIGEVAA